MKARDLTRVMSGNAGALLAAFATSVIVARELGPANRGVLAGLQTIPMLVVVLADAGLRQVLMRRHAASLDVGGANAEITGACLISALLAGALSMLLGAMILSDEITGPRLLGLGLASAGGLALIVSKGLFLVEGRTLAFAATHTSAQFVGLLAIFLVSTFGTLTLDGAWAILVLAVLIPSVVTSLAWMRFGSVQSAWQRIPGLYREAWRYALPMFLAMANYRFGILCLTALGMSEEAGLFVVATSMAELLWQLPGSVGLLVFAERLKLPAKQGGAGAVYIAIRTLLAVAAAGAILFAAAPFLVETIFGSEFASAANCLRLLLPGVVVFSLFKILHAHAAASGDPLFAVPVLLSMLIINLVFGVAAAVQFGLEGLALIVGSAYLLAGAMYFQLFLRKYGRG